MKLHLPLSLRSSLLAIFAVTTLGVTAQAATLHRDVSFATYTDFGQNAGRYVVGGEVNELLNHIRQNEGVVLTYTGGQSDYVLEHGMIDFGSSNYLRRGAAVSYSAMATVGHNPTAKVGNNFSSATVGFDHCINYKAISHKYTSNFSYTTSRGYAGSNDAAVVRLSKVITDAPVVQMYDTVNNNLNGLTYYTSSAGDMKLAKYTNYSDIGSVECWEKSLVASGAYAAGGIATGNVRLNYGDNKLLELYAYFMPDGVEKTQLPWRSEGGDSGCAVYVWDEEGGYQFVGANYGHNLAGGVPSSYIASDIAYINSVLESQNVRVDMSHRDQVHLNAVTTEGETIKGSGENNFSCSTTLYSGNVTGVDGSVIDSYNGVRSNLNTWADLIGLKDTQNWYNYGDSYLQQSVEDLFYTENLVFSSAGNTNRVVLNATVDLGIGYAQFSLADGATSARYDISSAGDGSNQFNHAGYVIDSGVEVHLSLTGSSSHMYEWRKVGAGDLYIEGSGNNDILLNVGGAGKTYLNREGGYAAYNVLVNNGSTIIIKDVDQIKRDLTFGNRGGTLNMNGLSMDWYATAEAADENRTGFSINALTEAALIANDKGNSTLTYKETKDSTYVGSFADTATASLKIVHDSDATWTLNSIHTNLQHADSGLLVNRGTVVLEGTNTVHGKGSATGESSERYFNEDDWHYADARMNVTVENSGTFELGSHARLTGDVTVQQGGTFVMREGVCHQMEYVEGGARLEDTDQYSTYFGHKGDVVLNGGTFAVQFNEGADSTLEYAGNVTGQGSMTVDTGVAGGTLSFSGTVDAGVSKTLEHGQLVLTGAAAAETSNKWLVRTGGVMAQLDNVSDTLAVIDGASSGIIGLKGGVCSEQFDFSATHSQLGIGALAGETVQYGAAGTSETLRVWNLGGGGRLEVNYVLSGDSTLNVDAVGMSGGEVSLQQVAGYSGTVNVQSAGGKMTLFTAQNGALNAATVNLNEGGVWKLAEGQSSGGTVNINNGGVLDTGAISGGTVNVNAGGLIQGADVALTGGFVELRGNMAYGTFTVSNGATLNLREGGRLDADNAATIAQGGIMRLNGQTLHDKVELKNGGTMYGNGGTIGAAATVLAAEGTGKLNAGGGTLTINGKIGAAKGATLRLENGAVNFNAQYINNAGGTLELACGSVELAHRVNGTTQYIDGTLNIAENVTITVNQGNPNAYQSIEHNFNHIHITQGKKLTLIESGNDWRHVFNLTSLSGQGEIVWQANNRYFSHTAMGPSRLILEGENSFKGTLLVNQLDNHGSMQHVSLAHDYAGRDMVINMWGDENSRPALAISTNNAHVAGIGGTAHTFVYAGAVKTSGDGNNPVSTALNTLTINTAGVNHTYHGTILGDATNGLNIVKTGEGAQAFSNAGNVVHDVTALQGHLNFTAAPTIHGDVSIAQGAELTIGSGAYTLNSGHTLNVLAGTPGEKAVLNNALVLNGGSLHFEAYSNNVGDAALSTNGVSGTGTTTVSFGNAGAIEWGTSQWVASGNWSSVESLLTVHAPEYMNATLSAGTQGLSAVFSMKDGYYRWGDTGSQPGAGDTVVFIGGSGAEIAGTLEYGKGLFDSATTYTVSGGALTLDTMVKSNRGDLVLNAAVAADTLIVKEAATITGNGSLSTETLTVEADMITGLSVQAADIQGNKHTWTLDGSENRFTQQATVSQINSFSQVSVTGQAELELATDVDATLNIAINGDGSVSKGGAGKLTTTEEVQIGTLNVDAGAYEAQGRVDIDTLSAAAGAEVTMYNSTAGAGAEKHLGAIELGTGAVFQTNDRVAVTAATSVGDLSLTGTAATLQDQYHSGFYNIGSLSLGEGLTTATLDIVKKADSTNATVVNLGNANSTAGNFKGRIALSSSTGETGDAKRSLFLVLGESQAAAGASINMKAADSSTAILGLGINTASATIAGLESSSALSNRAKVFSGFIGTKVQWGSDSVGAPGTVGKEVRTLTIDTASGCNYVFYGEVMENLNLVKEGAGTQELAGSSANFNGSIRVENGTLKLGSSALGMLEKASSVVVNGGRLDLSAAGKSVELTNVSGEGSVVLQYNVEGNGTAFDFSSFGGVVELVQGRILLNESTFGDDCPDFLLTSSNSQLVFNGNGTVVNSNVHISANTTDWHVNSGKSGTIGGDITGNSLVKHGGGSLTVGGNMKLDSTLSTYTGQVILTGAENSIANVDGAMQNGNTAGGTLRLAQDARLEITGEIWSRSNTGIHLDSGAVLDISGKSLSIANRAEEGTASLAATTATGPGAYAIDRTDYQISNAHVTYTGGDATVRNTLTNAAIENAGSGVLKVWNAANSLTGVQATKGEIRLFGQAEHQLNHLEVAEGLKVSAYTGVNEKAEMYAALHVSGLAEFGSGATLNADMVLQSGAVVDMGGTVKLDGVLTLQAGLTLDGAVLDAVQGLEVGESYTLFTNVDGLNVQSLQQAVTLYNMRSLAEQTNDAVSYSALMEGEEVTAADYFSNLSGNTGLVLSFNSADGSVTIKNQAVPEPTSATLSLLALAGLCARRRRR